MSIRVFVKYRCMTCPGTPWIGQDDAAYQHLVDNVGHELTARTTSEEIQDEGGEGE